MARSDADPLQQRFLGKESSNGRDQGHRPGQVSPGKVEEWKRLSAESMEIVRTRDSGTLQYEIFFHEDESEAVMFERYRDADAANEHFANIGHLLEPLMATATVTGELMGRPSAKMREKPAKFGERGPKAAWWRSPYCFI